MRPLLELNPVPPLAAVSYVRVSTPRQVGVDIRQDGYSIAAQREANRRHAHQLGALIVAEFIERGRSARSTDRPELQRMLKYVDNHEVDYVIVHKVDRLARNRGDDAQITEILRLAGARLASTTEGIDSTPNGRLLHGIMASIAEFYSQNLAAEVMKGMRQKAIQGGTVGRAPLGYLSVRTVQNGRDERTVEVDVERGYRITWAFHRYATGEVSMSQLADALNQQGMTTRATPTRDAGTVTTRTVHLLLTNPYYKGVVTLNGAQYPGTHEALVDEATWADVQDVLAARRNGERSRIHNHFLKSTVHCYSCGRRLIVHHARSKTGRVYDYFICSGRQSKTTGCKQRAIPIWRAEQFVEEAYLRIKLYPEQRQTLEKIALARLRRRMESLEIRAAEGTAQLQQIDEHRSKLLEAHYAGAIPRELFLTEQRRLNKAQANATKDLAEATLDTSTAERDIRDTLDLVQNAHDLYIGADEATKLQLNRAIFKRVLIGNRTGDLRIELNETYPRALEPDTK